MRTHANICLVGATLGAALLPNVARALEFKTETFDGSFNSTLTTGAARRTSGPNCAMVGDASHCAGAVNAEQWSALDDGNLNYRGGDWFTLYLKGVHELLLKHDSGLTFFARGAWKKDFKADDTRRTDLSDEAKAQIVNNSEMLDLWVSKNFSLGEQNGRVRFGQQVISWGEALYTTGGVASNVYDYQKLLVPGTQLKEAFLPVQALSVTSSLSATVSAEAYYQLKWRRARMPPVGSYFSPMDYYDRGRGPVSYSATNPNVMVPDQYSTAGAPRRMSQDDAVAAIYGSGTAFALPIVGDQEPKKGGQYGASIKWSPEDTQVNFGFYAVNYHEQLPVLRTTTVNSAALGADIPALQWLFRENRQMYGMTSSFPLGNWAVGTELSYRPRDTVTLSGCFNPGGPLDNATNAAPVSSCELYKDNKKYQFSVTALLQLQKSEHPFILNTLGADSGFLSIEAAVTRYPGMSRPIRRTLNGVEVLQVASASYLPALDRSNPNYPINARLGTETSWGYVVDFNLTYDGSPLPGWQLVPGMTFTHAVRGDTPNASAQFLEGNKSVNFYVMLNQNPVKWQFGLNYTNYFGGKGGVFQRQYLKDRDFLGMFASYSF